MATAKNGEFQAVLKASAEVSAAEAKVEQARGALNAAGGVYLKKFGTKITKLVKVGKHDDGKPIMKTIESMKTKPILGEDGFIYEILMRGEDGSIVVRRRELA